MEIVTEQEHMPWLQRIDFGISNPYATRKGILPTCHPNAKPQKVNIRYPTSSQEVSCLFKTFYNTKTPSRPIATAPAPAYVPAAAFVEAVAAAGREADAVAEPDWVLDALPLNCDATADGREDGTSVMVTPAAAQSPRTADVTSVKLS